MLSTASFPQQGHNASRTSSQAAKSRHGRGPSQGRRPKAERVISMSRNVSHKSDVGDVPTTATPHWTKNEKYCVTRLAARPPQVDNTAQYPKVFGTTSGDSSYALISTPESVFVWSYITHHSDPVVLTFPVRSREPSLATLVSPNAGSHEPGLVLVKVTGQVAYWDAVGAAVAEGLIQRTGVQATIPLLQDETITYLCNAEPAGFVVATSKGSLWDVSTRDSEGRPSLSYVGMTNTGGVWLSGIRSFISGGHVRTDIVAVKAGIREEHLERREVFVATKRGFLEKWELARGGVYRLSSQGDISLQMQETLRERLSVDLSPSVVDIAPVPTAAGGASDSLIVLASYSFHDSLAYAIFQCSFPEGHPPRILNGTILPPAPTDYATNRPAATVQPQLYVPSPGRSAFISYSRGFAVISLPSGSKDWPYCDIASFREDHANLRVIGSGQEDLTYDRTSNRKLRNPGVVLVIQGAGVVRVETFDAEIGDTRVLTSGTGWIQSKVEQAIFYGVAPENPLDFKPRLDWNWKLYEVENVVSKISTEILTSTSKYTQIGLPLDEFLVSKTQSLIALAHYIQSFFPDVSYATRQHLLLDAEKAEAVRKLWQTWGKRLETYDSHDRGTQILEGVVKDMRREATGEAIYTDAVKEWFRNEAGKIGELVFRSLRACQKYVRSQHGKDALVLAKATLEANEIALYSVTAAHDFRVKHQDIYAVETPNPSVRLPSSLAPWTSSPEIISTLAPQYDATLSVLREVHASLPTEVDVGARRTRQQTENMEREDVRLALEETLASLAEMLCKLYSERVTWCRALADNEKDRSDAEELWKQYLVKRGDWIKPLASFGRSDKALDIAEIYRDYKSLVELCLEHRDDDAFHREQIHERLECYLMHFGEEFAFTLYNFYIQNQMFVSLLTEFPREKASLKNFLQPQKYEKLRWIHELSLNRYEDAGHTLQEVAIHERRLRQKKLSLSIAKLSLLVTLHPTAPAVGTTDHVDIALAGVNAQSQFTEEIIKPVVEHCVDNASRVELALEKLYLARNLKKSHLRTRVVKRGLETLVDEKVVDAETLIDLFTLKKRGQGPAAETEFETYFWALQVLRASDIPEARKEVALRLIWLRAYLQDDWPKIEGFVLAMPEDEVEAAWRATAIYQIIRHAMNFEVMGSTISPFRPLSPSEAILDRETLLATLNGRFSGWTEADVDRYGNESLAESEALKKWAGKLEGDEGRLLGSLQSLAKKDLDASRGLDKVREQRLLLTGSDEGEHAIEDDAQNEDVEMIY